MAIGVLSCSKSGFSAVELKKTEKQIHFLKHFFSECFAETLSLSKVSAPLFVESGTGINDDLNGVEKPVSFLIPGYSSERTVEVVQSLAKWKRMVLKHYEVPVGEGIYADMRAIRPQDTIDCTHSAYVDQWDWELTMAPTQRNSDFLKLTVEKIYKAIFLTEQKMYETFFDFEPILPSKITFVQTEDLCQMYPGLSPTEREHEICKKYGAVFLIGIGGVLSDGKPHDGRAPDYDDWSSLSSGKYKGLNGDILVWHPGLQAAFELSSMGIRVDSFALKEQLKISGQEKRADLMFHSKVLSGELPQSIGGGIGQSRLAMFLLRKDHISQVQAALF